MWSVGFGLLSNAIRLVPLVCSAHIRMVSACWQRGESVGALECGLYKWCLCWHFGIKDLSGNFFSRCVRQIYGGCGLAVSPGKPRLARGEFWSCHGSLCFGDTILWGTRGTRGARGWDASAIPPRMGLVCLFFFFAMFFPQLLCGREVRVQTWMAGVVPRAHRRLRVIVCFLVQVITQRAAPHQCMEFVM